MNLFVFESIHIDYLLKSSMNMCQTCENGLLTGSIHLIGIHLNCQSDDPQLVFFYSSSVK